MKFCTAVQSILVYSLDVYKASTEPILYYFRKTLQNKNLSRTCISALLPSVFEIHITTNIIVLLDIEYAFCMTDTFNGQQISCVNVVTLLNLKCTKVDYKYTLKCCSCYAKEGV